MTNAESHKADEVMFQGAPARQFLVMPNSVGKPPSARTMLRRAVELTEREMHRYYKNGGHPDLAPLHRVNREALKLVDRSNAHHPPPHED